MQFSIPCAGTVSPQRVGGAAEPHPLRFAASPYWVTQHLRPGPWGEREPQRKGALWIAQFLGPPALLQSRAPFRMHFPRPACERAHPVENVFALFMTGCAWPSLSFGKSRAPTHEFKASCAKLLRSGARMKALHATQHRSECMLQPILLRLFVSF